MTLDDAGVVVRGMEANPTVDPDERAALRRLLAVAAAFPGMLEALEMWKTWAEFVYPETRGSFVVPASGYEAGEAALRAAREAVKP